MLCCGLPGWEERNRAELVFVSLASHKVAGPEQELRAKERVKGENRASLSPRPTSNS